MFRIRIGFHADVDPGSQKCPYVSMTLNFKTPLQIIKHKVLQRDPFMFTVLYSPNEPVYFLGFIPPESGSASVHAEPDPGGISLCGSGSVTLNPDPQHWLALYCFICHVPFGRAG